MASDGQARRLEMRFLLSFIPVIVRAVLHKEFVGAKSDKLLGRLGFIEESKRKDDRSCNSRVARGHEPPALVI